MHNRLAKIKRFELSLGQLVLLTGLIFAPIAMTCPPRGHDWIARQRAEECAANIAGTFKKTGHLPDMRRFARANGLIWCFESSGSNVNAAGRHISGERGIFPSNVSPTVASTFLPIVGARSFDCVRPLTRDRYLHVGTALLTPYASPNQADKEQEAAQIRLLIFGAGLLALFYLAVLYLYVHPIRRFARSINNAALTHRDTVLQLPDRLKLSFGTGEIMDLSRAVSALAADRNEQESRANAQEKLHTPTAKTKAKAGQILVGDVPNLRADEFEGALKKSSSTGGSLDVYSDFSGDAHDELKTFPDKTVRMVYGSTGLGDEANVSLAYVSIARNMRLKIEFATIDDEGHREAIEAMLSGSSSLVEAMLQKQTVQATEGAMSRYGLSDLKSRFDVSALLFLKLSQDADRCIGIVILSDMAAHRALNIPNLRTKILGLGSVLEELKSKANKAQQEYLNPLTQLPNRHYLDNKLMQVFETRAASKSNKDPYSVIAIGLSTETAFLDDEETQTQRLALAHLIASLEPKLNRLDESSAYAPYLIEAGDNLFFLINGWFGNAEARNFANKLIERLTEKRLKDPRASLPLFSVGVASFPKNADNLQSLIYASELALHYARSTGQPLRVAAADDLPPHVQPPEEVEIMRGDTSILDAAVLLQSIKTSGQTGEMRVRTTDDGRVLRILWTKGRPVSARYGNLSGAPAIIEFFCTSSAGEYVFVQREIGGITQVIEDQINFDKVLMDAALASDYMQAARADISATDNIVGANDALDQLSSAKELDCSETEFAHVVEVLKAAPGAANIAGLKKTLPHLADYQFWRACYLAKQNNNLTLKKELAAIQS